MRLYLKFIVYLLLIFHAHETYAAVIINEVAWMGGFNSANHEWIELRNTDNKIVSTEGWVLSDGNNLNIELSGNIPANGYVVLERSSDGSAIGSAFLIYTGALVNTGATLTLRNASGEIIDQVAGGENWENIGGDNTTKDTAQYTTNGWVTDARTPGKQNKTGRVEPVESTVTTKVTESNSSKTTSSKTSIKTNNIKNEETVRLVVPDTVLKLTPDIQSVAYINQTIPFSVTGSGISEVITKSLKYDWNFGDMHTATGREVEHSYSYPGTYVVVVHAQYARHDQVARHEITVLPVTFSLTKNENGDIQVNNDSPYDVDISGFTVKGNKSLTFPPRTIILPKSTITVPKEKLGGTENSLLALYDTKKSLIDSTYKESSFLANAVVEERELAGASKVAFQENLSSVTVEPSSVDSEMSILIPTDYVTPDETKSIANAKFTFAETVELPKEDDGFEEILLNNSTSMNTTTSFVKNESVSVKPNLADVKWPYLAFIILLIVSFVGLFWSRRV